MRVWLTSDEAARYVGRSTLTLRSWRLKGLVRARKRKGAYEFEKTSLRRAREQMEWNYSHRRIVPGSGRGRHKCVDVIPLWDDKELREL